MSSEITWNLQEIHKERESRINVIKNNLESSGNSEREKERESRFNVIRNNLKSSGNSEREREHKRN
jgi:hypothetical protein